MVDGFILSVIMVAIVMVVLIPLVWYVAHLKMVPYGDAVVVRRKRGGQEVVRVVLGAASGLTYVRHNPLTERFELLDLSWGALEHTLPGVVTRLDAKEVRFTLHIVVRYGIVPDPAMLQRKADQLLMGPRAGLEARVREVVDAKVREVCRRRTPPQVYAERDVVSGLVRDAARDELRAKGLMLMDVVITDLEDDDGYLEELRRPRATGGRESR